MRIRSIPQEINIYSYRDSKRYIKEKLTEHLIVDLAILVARLILYPVYFIIHLIKCTWTAIRYCTYSFTDKEEQVVEMILKINEKPQIRE